VATARYRLAEAGDRVTHEASASKTTNSVPQQRPGEPEPIADGFQTGESDRSVRPLPFDRLLTVAVLTPGQALLLAAQLLDTAHMSGPGNGAHPAAARVGAVTLTPSGDLAVGPSEDDQGTAVTELLSQLLQNARRLPAHPTPEQLSLLHKLEEAAGDPALEPDARARELEARWPRRPDPATGGDSLGSCRRWSTHSPMSLPASQPPSARLPAPCRRGRRWRVNAPPWPPQAPPGQRLAVLCRCEPPRPVRLTAAAP